MSSNALTSTGGGVGWQVDLPGLSSLLLNLGSAGLKRFAEAGVDFHTILCFGEIAEVCPASIEYRKQLSICRQEQRKESQWFYKVIEIGSATNFVADELLKKRAGENVVALMSSILPVMPESTCDVLLLKLFEASSAPLDKTPGFGQLRSLRETLAPLARKADFKDRVFQYHILAKQLLEEIGTDAQTAAPIALPNEETAVQVILLLAKLVQEDTESILEYRGLKGAGWVIAYARHILGLPVCVLKSSSNTVPISGDYITSKVFVYIFDNANECQIVKRGVVRDLFLSQSLDMTKENAWALDVSKTHVLDIHIPKSDPMRKVASSIAHSMLYDFTHLIAKSFNPKHDQVHVSESGLIPYTQYCLPAVRKRARRSLELLGFDPPGMAATRTISKHWSSYFETKAGENDQKERCEDAGVTTPDSEAYLAAGPARIQHDPGPSTPYDIHQLAAYGEGNEARLAEKDSRQIKFIGLAAEIVSWLAFTDWDENLRMLSTHIVENFDSWRPGYSLYKTCLDNRFRNYRDLLDYTCIERLCGMAIDLVIGGRETWTPNFISGNMLAFQHRSIVFKSSAALNQSLDVEASLLHCLPGAIFANGEKREKIYAYPSERAETTYDPTPQTIETSCYKPANCFPSLMVSTRICTSGHDIFLEQHVVLGNDILPTPNPASAFGSLMALFVTEPCEHDYYETLEVSKIDAVAARTPCSRKPTDSAHTHHQSKGHFSMPDLHQGFFVGMKYSYWDADDKLYLQAVDQNPLGQWLAYQTWQYGHIFTVLQRHCCLKCTYDMIENVAHDAHEMSSQLRYGHINVIRIVNGRLEGEDME